MSQGLFKGFMYIILILKTYEVACEVNTFYYGHFQVQKSEA